MRPGRVVLLLAAAGLLVLVPAPGAAQLLDVLRSPPPLDRGLELELRGYYLSPDDFRRDDPPADSLGRQRLEEVKERAGYRYVKRAGDAVLERVLREAPVFVEFEQYFRDRARFEFLNPDEQPAEDGDDATLFEPPLSALGRLEAWTGMHARFAVRVGIDRITPGVELRRAPLRGRVSYDVTRERLESVVQVPTGLPVQVELSHRAFLDDGAYEVQLAVGFAF